MNWPARPVPTSCSNYPEPDAADQVRPTPPLTAMVEVALGGDLEPTWPFPARETLVVAYAAEPPDPVPPVAPA